jgi:hypothetical protein
MWGLVVLQEQLATILATFGGNVESVKALMRFDSNVLEFALQHLESLQDRLLAVHADNSRMNVANTLSMLRNIRTNHSLEPHYRQMLNQCNVLLVSYFSAAVGDIFRAGVADAVRNGTREAILKEEIRIDLRELRDIGSEVVERSGELLAEHREISFQNVHNVAKTFRDYFGYKREQDETVNDLILSHACRHVIVHNAAVADRKMIGQLRAARPRTLKPDIHVGERIQFSEEEILTASERMIAYLGDLAEAVYESADVPTKARNV